MSEVAHTTARPVPEEWPELYELAQRAVIDMDANPAGNHTGLRQLGTAIEPLGRVTLINNSYVAYSRSICGFARYLAEPGARQQAIVSGATELVKQSQHLTGGMSALGTPAFRLDRAFRPATRAGYRSINRPTQLLGNYLTVVEVCKSADEFSALPAYSGSILREVIPMMFGGDTAMEGGLRAIAASPRYILGTVLSERGVNIPAGEIPSRQAIEKLRHPSVKRLAARLCTVTSDESFGENEDVIKVGNEAVAFIPPSESRPTIFSPKAQVLPSDEAFDGRRTIPLVCPALHVRGVVPMVMDMTVDMLDEARKQLTA